jgi:DNA-binding response OmpR family regulator
LPRTDPILGCVLLAEDEPGVRFTFKSVLEEAGYKVRAVPSFAEAQNYVRQGDYDAVITELSLEKGELGLELAREAKKRKPAPAVVIYTAEPTVERLRAALALQVDYLALKPVDLDEIRSALFRLISRRTVSLAMATH